MSRGIESTEPIPGIGAQGWQDEARATLTLAWPLILGNIAQMLINTTDVLILGRYNVDALAAAALGLNLYWAFAIFGMGLVTAASPMIAAERGKRSHSVRDVRRTVRQAFWAAATLCVPIWLILWNAEALLLLLGQEPELAKAAAGFVRIAMWGLPGFLGFLILRNYVTALERPIWGLVVTGAGVVVNAVACWALVFGFGGLPALGLDGAAIANALANTFLFGLSAAIVTRLHPFRRYHLFGRFWRSDWARYREIMRLGLPIAVTLALEVTIFNAAVFLMGLINRPSLAAHAVAIQLASLAFMLPLGLAQAATVRVGVSHGRGDARGVAIAGWTAIALCIGVAIILSTIMALFASQLVGLFLTVRTPSEQVVFDLAVGFVIVAAIFQLVDATQAVGAGVLRGIHDTRWPMIFAGFGYWVVGLGVAVLLGFELGFAGVGIWIGLASGLAVVAVLMVARWLMRGRLGLVAYNERTR